MENFRREPVRSSKYRDGSRDQPCTLRIPGCDGGGETTVFAHIRDRHTGRSIKASDISGADACFWCHAVFDRRQKTLSGEYLSDFDWLLFALRGLQETQENRIARGLLLVTQDAVRDKPVKPRKPRGQRRTIHKGKPLETRSDWPAKGTRPLRSRNTMKERGV